MVPGRRVMENLKRKSTTVPAKNCLLIRADIWNWWQINLQENLHLLGIGLNHFHDCLPWSWESLVYNWSVSSWILGRSHRKSANTWRRFEISCHSVNIHTIYHIWRYLGNISLFKRKKKLNKCILLNAVIWFQEFQCSNSL